MKFLSNLTITFTQVFILANAITPSDSCSKSSRWLINGQWYIFTRARLHYNQLIWILDRWFVPPVCPCGRSQNINLMCSQWLVCENLRFSQCKNAGQNHVCTFAQLQQSTTLQLLNVEPTINQITHQARHRHISISRYSKCFQVLHRNQTELPTQIKCETWFCVYFKYSSRGWQ